MRTIARLADNRLRLVAAHSQSTRHRLDAARNGETNVLHRPKHPHEAARPTNSAAQELAQQSGRQPALRPIAGQLSRGRHLRGIRAAHVLRAGHLRRCPSHICRHHFVDRGHRTVGRAERQAGVRRHCRLDELRNVAAALLDDDAGGHFDRNGRIQLPGRDRIPIDQRPHLAADIFAVPDNGHRGGLSAQRHHHTAHDPHNDQAVRVLGTESGAHFDGRHFERKHRRRIHAARYCRVHEDHEGKCLLAMKLTIFAPIRPCSESADHRQSRVPKARRNLRQLHHSHDGRRHIGLCANLHLLALDLQGCSDAKDHRIQGVQRFEAGNCRVGEDGRIAVHIEPRISSGARHTAQKGGHSAGQAEADQGGEECVERNVSPNTGRASERSEWHSNYGRPHNEIEPPFLRKFRSIR